MLPVVRLDEHLFCFPISRAFLLALSGSGFAGFRPMLRKPPAACGNCLLPIEPGDFIGGFHGAVLIHVRCWRVEESAHRRPTIATIERRQTRTQAADSASKVIPRE